MIEYKVLSMAVRKSCNNYSKLYTMCQFCENINIILLSELSVEELIIFFDSCYEF